MKTDDLRDKTWFTSMDGGAVLAGSPCALPVRFYDPDLLRAWLIERWTDEVAECLAAASDGEWTDDGLVPLAALGLEDHGAASDEQFLRNSFGCVLHDRASDTVVLVTSDDWRRDNVIEGGLDTLGLAER